MVDDDLNMVALPETRNIKSIVTAEDRLCIERKNKQAVQGLLYVRFICFGNGLKDIYFIPELKQTLDVWDGQLAQYGSKIIERRTNFIEKINEIIKPIHKQLTGGLEDINIVYNKNCEAEDLLRRLEENRDRDIKYKSTSIGPHKDDLLFFNDDKNIRIYGSQGQQRTIALSLKLAELELVKNLINDTPVLLLDDVLSELDSERQNHLLNSIDDIQTIITCTGLDEFIENRFKINKVFQVTEGKVEEKTV